MMKLLPTYSNQDQTLELACKKSLEHWNLAFIARASELEHHGLSSPPHTRTCLMAVRKPLGLKNPVIQNTFGLPLKTQLRNCVSLSKSSVYQNPIVEESQLIFCHSFGTRASYMESSVSLKF